MWRRSNGLLELMVNSGRIAGWAGLVLAVGSCLALHWVAVLPGVAAHQGLRALAGLFEYILPAVFLAGTMLPVIQWRRGPQLLEDARSDPDGAVEGVMGQDFERLVAAGFEARGYRVTRSGGGGAGGGVDLVLKKDRERTLVQCIHWRSRTVGVARVRELFGVMAAQGAHKGIVVTVGEFTTDARDFANGRNLELLNGEALKAILHSRTGPAGATIDPAAAPDCPSCGSSMVRRIARQGPSTGQAFWGCSKFPSCRGTAAASQ